MSSEASNSTAADKIVELAQGLFRFGRSLEGEPFAVSKTGANVALFIRSGDDSSFQRRLARECRRAHQRVPTKQQMTDAVQTLLSECDDAAPEPCYCRVAPCSDGGIAVDLGTPDGKAALIYPNEPRWRITERSPVLFQRTEVMSAMPIPVAGGTLNEIPELLGISDRHWNLVAGWVCAAYDRDIPHPILAIFGPAGAGKSFLARLLVQLCDPSPCALRSSPRSEDDWHVAAASSWVYAIDNLSEIKPWFADALCKAATGDARAVRKLYSPKSLTVSCLKLPVILTGIEVGSLRSDLGDRLVMLELPRRQSVRTERELEAIIRQRMPYWLGALFDAVSRVLEARPFLAPSSSLPRMADFAHVLAAADKAGVTVGAAEAYEQNRRDTAQEVRDGDELVDAIAMLLQKAEGGRWEGFATELLQALNGLPGLSRGCTWPKASNQLSGRLKRLAPSLADGGVRYHKHRDGTTRKPVISLLLLKKEKASLGSLGSLANPETSAEKHALHPDDDRTIPERCLGAPGGSVATSDGCPNDDRAIPERCPNDPSEADAIQSSDLDREITAEPKPSLHAELRQLIGKDAEVLVTEDTEAVGLDGTSVHVSRGQTGFLAQLTEAATGHDWDFFDRLRCDLPKHQVVIIGDTPLLIDWHVMRLASRVAVA